MGTLSSGDRGVPGTPWPASRAGLVSSRFSESPCFKTEDREWVRKTLASNFYMYIHTPAHGSTCKHTIHVFVHTHTHRLTHGHKHTHKVKKSKSSLKAELRGLLREEFGCQSD